MAADTTDPVEIIVHKTSEITSEISQKGISTSGITLQP